MPRDQLLGRPQVAYLDLRRMRVASAGLADAGPAACLAGRLALLPGLFGTAAQARTAPCRPCACMHMVAVSSMSLAVCGASPRAASTGTCWSRPPVHGARMVVSEACARQEDAGPKRTVSPEMHTACRSVGGFIPAEAACDGGISSSSCFRSATLSRPMTACAQVMFRLGAAEARFDAAAGAYHPACQQLAALAMLLPSAVATHVLSLQPRGVCLNR